MSNDYVKGLKLDSKITLAAQAKFQHSKSEQQKMLEAVLLERYDKGAPLKVGDFACGTGHVSFHLAQLFTNAHFTLVDLNDSFVDEAAAVFGDEKRATFLLGDIEKLAPELSEQFDVAVCWQTLSWIEGYDKALPELIRALKPGGRLFATFLVNTEHDVDVLSRVVDYTRASAAVGMYGHYNTYSARRLREFVTPLATSIDIHPFHINIDLDQRPVGLGTYTVRCADGSRLQVSAGMLMNWALVEILK